MDSSITTFSPDVATLGVALGIGALLMLAGFMLRWLKRLF